MAYSKKMAVERKHREEKLQAFADKAAWVEGRVQGKAKSRGRPLSDEGAFQQLVREPLEKRLTA